MKFVFDLDDTICDTDGYSELYISKFIKENNLPYKQIAKVVRFAESKFDWDKDIALSWYKTHGDNMMLNFPCKTGAIEFINRLYDLGHQIVIATARSTDWHTKPEEITKKWLAINNIKYNKIYIGRVNKEKICEEEKADVFIDDDTKITKNVAEYFNQGKRVFLMTTAYNQDLDIANGVTRVDNFSQMAKNLKISLLESTL